MAGIGAEDMASISGHGRRRRTRGEMSLRMACSEVAIDLSECVRTQRKIKIGISVCKMVERKSKGTRKKKQSDNKEKAKE
jgi:hypothetical protein